MTTTPPLFPMEADIQTTDDYWTPSWVFEAMALTFDMDVCGPPGGISWIPAARTITMAEDGLSVPWDGRVWMNTPFSSAGPWVERFIHHRNGVALLRVAKSAWFHPIWEEADGIVLKGTDLSTFVSSNLRADIYQTCCLVAFGPECVEAIARIGVVRVAT
jgi:hypothetical protein